MRLECVMPPPSIAPKGLDYDYGLTSWGGSRPRLYSAAALRLQSDTMPQEHASNIVTRVAWHLAPGEQRANDTPILNPSLSRVERPLTPGAPGRRRLTLSPEYRGEGTGNACLWHAGWFALGCLSHRNTSCCRCDRHNFLDGLTGRFNFIRGQCRMH